MIVDFGKDFKIYDRDGEPAQPLLIESISQADPGVVKLNKQIPHNLQDGDFVSIHEVKGMTEVNGDEARPVKRLDDYSFSIEDTTDFREYISSGIAQIVKVPYKVSFRSLKEQLYNPQLPEKLTEDEEKIMYNLALNLLVIGSFYKAYNRLPQGSQEDIANFSKLLRH